MLFLLISLFFILSITAWALLGRGEVSDREEDVSPDKIFRRRALDHEIEEKYPDKKDKPARRKSDLAGEDISDDEEEDIKEKFSI